MSIELTWDELPGFGKEYDELHEQTERFSALESWEHFPMLTLRERWMLDFMNQVTDKPDWNRKVFDEEIIAHWKQETTEMQWLRKWKAQKWKSNYRNDDDESEIDEDDNEVQKGEPCDDFTEEMFRHVSLVTFETRLHLSLPSRSVTVLTLTVHGRAS